jgi:hypothetical protein
MPLCGRIPTSVFRDSRLATVDMSAEAEAKLSGKVVVKRLDSSAWFTQPRLGHTHARADVSWAYPTASSDVSCAVT